jgi:hypothetical protein
LDFLKENEYNYQYLGVDIRKEVVEEAKGLHPDEKFSSIQRIEDVPLDNYDLVFAHGVFTTQMDENDILEFVDYFSESNKIIFSFIRTNNKRVISKKKDIYTFYNPRNLKMYLSKNIESGNFNLSVLNDTDDFITWENTSMVNEGFLSNVGTAVMLAGLSLLYSCGTSAPKEDGMKQIEKVYGLKRANNIPSLKGCKEQIKLMVKSNTEIDDILKDTIISQIDKISFFIISEGNNKFGELAAQSNAFYTKLGGKIPVIVIRESHLKEADSKAMIRTLIHELSHYVDDLDNSKNEWDQVVDKNLTDKKYIRSKLDLMFSKNDFFNKYKIYVPNKYEEFINVEVNRIYNRISYFTSPEEMYVRGINFKMWLIESKQMTDINDDIEQKHIDYFIKRLDKESLNDGTDFYSFVVCLDFNQLM